MSRIYYRGARAAVVCYGKSTMPREEEGAGSREGPGLTWCRHRHQWVRRRGRGWVQEGGDRP